MTTNFYENQKELLFKNLNSLRTEDGLFRASNGEHYVQFTWWRDNFYASLPYLKNYPEKYMESYHTYLDIFKKFEEKYGKFSWMVKTPSQETCRYLHAKIVVETKDEGWWYQWGHKQNDATGYMLLGIYFGEKEGLKIIRDESDKKIIQLIIDYLIAVRFWETPDSGAWEENEEIRSSSIGISVRALEKMKEIGFNVDQKYIDKGRDALDKLLPLETPTRFVDLALLFLPFLNITDKIQTDYIIRNVEKYLTTQMGVKRYIADRYYNINQNNPIDSEPSWIFGNAYLSCIYKKNEKERNNFFQHESIANMYLDKILYKWQDGRIPELTYAKSEKPNDNRILCWSNAMTIVAIDMVLENEFDLSDILYK